MLGTRLRLLLGLWLSLTACSEDDLAFQYARIRVTPLPATDQLAIADPIGIHLRYVPLYGVGTAVFRIDNIGGAPLLIPQVDILTAAGGIFAVQNFSPEVKAHNAPEEAGSLTVTFVPAAAETAGEALLALHTNSGVDGREVVTVTVRGIGLFVGEPNLQVTYDGKCFSRPGSCLPGACATGPDGRETCVLDTLDFGNVPLSTTVTTELRLANVPLAGTCAVANCVPACRLTLDRDAAAFNLGLGFVPADAGFAVEGNVALPFPLDVSSPQCGFADQVRLLMSFSAGAVSEEVQATLVIETDDPDTPLVQIPLKAAARVAPVAVADFVYCDEHHLPPTCTRPEQVRPLDRVYLDGSGSYDPRDPADPSLIQKYEWRVLDSPPGASPADFAPVGALEPRFSLWLPVAGRYVVRLHVYNELGTKSGVGPDSDVQIDATPDSRVHVQLVWDHPTNDQDLHLTLASQSDLVCNADWDCFWGNCRPGCPTADRCRAAPPEWFPESGDPSTSPNPHLDIDDTNGLGPESIDLNRPVPGRYRVYAHYYGLVDLEDTPTQDVVRIFIDGTLRAEYRRYLRRNDLWRVAEIEWHADSTATIRAATTDGGGPGAVKPMLRCSEGFDFGSDF